MTNTKFNQLFIAQVLKPNSADYIKNGYVDRNAAKLAYKVFKNKSLDENIITKKQSDTFVITTNDLTKNHILK